MMFLFYTLLCRNYLEIDKNAKGVVLEVDSDFPEICPSLQILKIFCFHSEDDVKWKKSSRESCREFSPNGSGHKIPIRVRTAEISPIYCNPR